MMQDDPLKDMIRIHNEYRQSVGLNTLDINLILMQQATLHCQWMSKSNTLSHGSWFRGNTLPSRIKKSGYKYSRIAENIAQGYAIVYDQTFKNWLKSPGHYNNIIGDYTEFGVGRSGGYWCVIFGKPQ